MESTEEKARVDVRIEPLRGLPLALEIAGGIGRTLGLTLLWGLEIVRDSYFRLLDLKRFEELGALLTEDCTASYEDGKRRYDSRAGIVGFAHLGGYSVGVGCRASSTRAINAVSQ